MHKNIKLTKKTNGTTIKPLWGIQYFIANNCLNQEQVFRLDINESKANLVQCLLHLTTLFFLRVTLGGFGRVLFHSLDDKTLT